jgi:lipopolysaccharide export system protein LptA
MFRSKKIAVPATAGTRPATLPSLDKRVSALAGIAIRVAGITTLVALPLAGAGAQFAAPGDNQPIQIQADSGIEWQQDARLYIARGNVVATRGQAEIHADTLIAHYREAKGGNAGGNTEIYRLEAEGHVTVKRDTQTVVGDRAIYGVDQAIAVITGKALKLTTANDVVTARDSLEWYDQKQVAVARGNAVASRTGKTIKADILTAYMVKTAPGQSKTGQVKAGPAKPSVAQAAAPAPAKPGPAGAEAKPAAESKISRVDAQGHVVITNSLDTGRGDFGVYNADTGIATLIGNVVIERGKDVIRGQRGVMDLNNNISRMMPGGAPGAAPQRVQGLFVRKEQGGPAAASPAAANPGQNSGPNPGPGPAPGHGSAAAAGRSP